MAKHKRNPGHVYFSISGRNFVPKNSGCVYTGQNVIQAAKTHVKLEWYAHRKYFRRFITIN